MVKCHHLTNDVAMRLHLANALWRQMVELTNLCLRLRGNKRFTNGVKGGVNLLELLASLV